MPDDTPTPDPTGQPTPADLGDPNAPAPDVDPAILAAAPAGEGVQSVDAVDRAAAAPTGTTPGGAQ